MDTIIINRIQTTPEPLIHKRKISNRAIVIITVLLISILVLLYMFFLAREIITTKEFLFNGKNSLELAYENVIKGDFERAAGDFKDAKSYFIDANKTIAKPSIKILSYIPVINNNINAISRMSSAGFNISGAGEHLSNASSKFVRKDGRIDIKFDNGKLDVEALIRAKPYIEQANLQTLQAVAEYNCAPDSMLHPLVRGAKEELGRQLPKLEIAVNNLKQASDVMPDIFGAKKTRRYFLAIQNNSELRATGGLIGNYGIISIDEGKIRLEAFEEILKLYNGINTPAKAPADFVARYGRFKSTQQWENTNMSPDFPTVSRVILGLFRNSTGVALDGVISVDPIALSYLLKAIGPVKLHNDSITIDADNVVDWTLVTAYAKYNDRDQRKDFLADVAKSVWMRLASGQIDDKSELISQTQRALSEKHMAIYSKYSNEQQLAENLGYAGMLLPTTSDYAQVIMQNHGANKIDVYVHEAISYSVVLRADGSALSKMQIKIANRAPAKGLPSYVTGENPLGTKNGVANTWLNLYAPNGCQLLSVGKEVEKVDVENEKDKKVFSQYVRLAPGNSKFVNFSYELPDVLVFDGNQIRYILDWQVQPIINSPYVSITVTTPKGFDFSKIPDGFIRKGKAAVFQGVLVTDKKFEFEMIDNR